MHESSMVQLKWADRMTTHGSVCAEWCSHATGTSARSARPVAPSWRRMSITSFRWQRVVGDWMWRICAHRAVRAICDAWRIAVGCWPMLSIGLAMPNRRGAGDCATVCASGLAGRWRISVRSDRWAEPARCCRHGGASAFAGSNRTMRRSTGDGCDHAGRSVRQRCDEWRTVESVPGCAGRHSWCGWWRSVASGSAASRADGR